MFTVLRSTVVILSVLAIVAFVDCGPSDEELAALVEAKISRQVALIPLRCRARSDCKGHRAHRVWKVRKDSWDHKVHKG